MVNKSINSGIALEKFVCELYSDLGRSNVTHNVRIWRTIGEIKVSGQIDLTYKFLFSTKYVECKYRENNNVNFDDYAKFETTLKTFNISTYNGEIVTNKKFDSKVIARAKETGIKLIDIDELKKLDSSRVNGYRLAILAYNFASLASKTNIINALNVYYKKFLPIESQIRNYRI